MLLIKACFNDQIEQSWAWIVLKPCGDIMETAAVLCTAQRQAEYLQ